MGNSLPALWGVSNSFGKRKNRIVIRLQFVPFEGPNVTIHLKLPRGDDSTRATQLKRSMYMEER